jgi:hypothetical protein
MALDTIIKGGLSGVIGGVTDIIDRFVTTPDEKAKAIIELRQLEVRETEAIVNAASAAIVAEAQSDDPYVRRSRPTFLYIMYGVILWNFIFLPVFQFFTDQPMLPLDLPEALYYLFGGGFLGYVGARSWDKKAVPS